MKVKIVEKSDLSGALLVEELSGKIFPDFVRWHYSSVLGYIKMGSKVFLAELEGKPVGFAFFRKFNEELWELTLIGVLPEHRGKGIGKALLEESLKSIKGEIQLHVQTNNVAAIRLYERFNFVREKVLRGFYSDGSDAYLMVRHFYPHTN
ncbi:MAG: N-acetyltransferase [candidate division WOR-3 bacterium]